MKFSFKLSALLPRFICGLALCGAANLLQAQSLDPAVPAPVRSNQLTGRIAPRDLGDSRLTDHYFAFTGTPGDLLITVQSTNLNGDIDVFTAGTLRPLLKLTLYAESSAAVKKGIYLRKREDLILRVEARTPNDDEGIYTLSFSGSFEPIIGGPDVAETEAPVSTPGFTRDGRRTKRVSSVGARINEPEPPVEVASATPTPEPSPEATPVETPAVTKTEKPATVNPPKTTPPRTSRGRRPAGRRTPTTRPAETAKIEEPPKPEGETETTDETIKPKPTPRSSSRRTATARQPKAAPPEPEPEIGPRLIIETNDGTLINRSMSTVRRVTVENGQVVVTGKDGKIDRIMLVNILRMSIAP
ncbi:MAG TPA: hypothetical protein VLB68_24240 [Pyrinomonadaceae bacterium]|nr:hypothetical protein [Pyrinomonadaceae bacterium]